MKVRNSHIILVAINVYEWIFLNESCWGLKLGRVPSGDSLPIIQAMVAVSPFGTLDGHVWALDLVDSSGAVELLVVDDELGSLILVKARSWFEQISPLGNRGYLVNLRRG